MADRKVMDYIENSINKGHSWKDVKKKLLKEGWPEKEISTAFRQVVERTENKMIEKRDKNDNFSMVLLISLTVLIIVIIFVALHLRTLLVVT